MPLPTKTDADLLADELDRRGLSTPAALLIDAHRPLVPLFRQGAIFAAPLLGPLFGMRRLASLMRHLDEPEALDRLVDRLRSGRRDGPEGA